MWIMYVCLSAVGFIACLFIQRKTLSKQHEVTKTGLEAEKANAAEEAQKKADKKAHRDHKHGDDSDVEKGMDHVDGSKA